MFPFDFTEVSPGPVHVGTDWTTFTFKPPMAAELRQKGVLLELPAKAKWTDIYEGTISFDGKQTKLTAEAVGVDGKVYPLSFISPMVPTGYKELYVVLLSQQFPQSVLLNSVRVRATEPITFGRVLWMNSTPH
jgi:hypothetical protein